MKRKQTPHMGVRPGKRVRIALTDGEVVIGRFKERTDRYLFIDERRIPCRNVRSFSQYKPMA